MKASERGVRFIQKLETGDGKPILKAYWDHTNYAIGYGHNSPDIRKGQFISPFQADQYFRQDLDYFERCVSRLVLVDLKQNQFDALVSFAYNIGCGGLKGSSALRAVNRKQFSKVGRYMMRWNKPAGVKNRRRKEVKLWNGNRQFFTGNRMKKLAVVVGHNKRRQGAVCQHAPLKGTSEWVYNNEIADLMAQHAPDFNLETRVFYRDGKLGYSSQVSKAYKAADRWGADCVIELHFNGSQNKSARYSTTLVAEGSHQALRFGQQCQVAIVRAFGRSVRQDRGITTRTRADRGGWSLLAGKAPTVLVEPFFGSNPQDCKLAAKQTTKTFYARGLLRATQEFLDARPRDNLVGSRTLAGSGMVGFGEFGPQLIDSASDLQMVMDYMPVVNILGAALTIAGVGLIIYSRWDDFRKGKR